MEPKGVVAASQPQWIPVTERLPEPLCGVLVSCGDVVVCSWINFTGKWFGVKDSIVTHWMPIPQPYKEV